jgi:D-glycero-D-manno-heptose 1,7-bisphosphate phosphatase
METARRAYTIPRRAVFLDRDGTIIVDRHFVRSPEDVELVPGAATAIRYLNNALIPVVVVTNQSGIARGILTEEDYGRVRARLDDLLGERDAFVDATYHCPHHPDFGGECKCRKPGTALFEQAIHELNLSPAQCSLIGDRWRDIAPAQVLGGRGILVPSPATPAADIERARAELEVADSLLAAVAMLIGTPHTGASD